MNVNTATAQAVRTTVESRGRKVESTAADKSVSLLNKNAKADTDLSVNGLQTSGKLPDESVVASRASEKAKSEQHQLQQQASDNSLLASRAERDKSAQLAQQSKLDKQDKFNFIAADRFRQENVQAQNELNDKLSLQIEKRNSEATDAYLSREAAITDGHLQPSSSSTITSSSSTQAFSSSVDDKAQNEQEVTDKSDAAIISEQGQEKYSIKVEHDFKRSQAAAHDAVAKQEQEHQQIEVNRKKRMNILEYQSIASMAEETPVLFNAKV